MTHKLVIAEKPSVARSIAGVIGATEKHAGYLEGNGYVVSWCIGHLVPLLTLAAMTSVSRNGAMRICPSSRSRGSILFPTIRNSSLTFCVP